MFVSKWTTVAKNALQGDGNDIILVLKYHFRTGSKGLELCAIDSEYLIILKIPGLE